ncbi:MAG: hypothetical protein M3Z05_05625 [Gemmatimonadota bacterium]|nr:hypothetical protein [Gemmatimonadota bacterium]
MAPLLPDPKKIKSFRSQASFEKWLASNHARETELWLKIHKNASGLATVTAAAAVYHATGVRVRELPVRIEDLLKA